MACGGAQSAAIEKDRLTNASRGGLTPTNPKKHQTIKKPNTRRTALKNAPGRVVGVTERSKKTNFDGYQSQGSNS